MITHFSFQDAGLAGAYIIQPFIATDERGEFVKDYSQEIFTQHGLTHEVKEVFYTVSRKGVIRAIHFQRVMEQPKLVRCISGRVYDVIVDLRPESPTFKEWRGFWLTGANHLEIYVPKRFGHGYLVAEDSIVSYKCAEKFYSEYDDGIIWNDPEIAIEWPLWELDCPVILSEKDKNLQSCREFFT